MIYAQEEFVNQQSYL